MSKGVLSLDVVALTDLVLALVVSGMGVVDAIAEGGLGDGVVGNHGDDGGGEETSLGGGHKGDGGDEKLEKQNTNINV